MVNIEEEFPIVAVLLSDMKKRHEVPLDHIPEARKVELWNIPHTSCFPRPSEEELLAYRMEHRKLQNDATAARISLLCADVVVVE